MAKRKKESRVLVLGEKNPGEKISESLRRNCEVSREIPQGKKIDYIFYLTKKETPEIKKILDLAVLNGAKFLYLISQTQVGSFLNLVFEYERNSNLDARVVKAPPLIFENPQTQEERVYLNNCLEEILKAMFGVQTRGGLFLLKEPPLPNPPENTLNEEIKENRTRKRRSPLLSFKKIILVILSLFLLPPLLTIFFSLLGFSQLIFSQKSFFAGEVKRAAFLLRIAAPSFAIAQKTLKTTTFTLFFLEKKGPIQDLEALLSAANEISEGGNHLFQGIILWEPMSNFLSSQSSYSNEKIGQIKTELLLAQERLIRAELNLANVQLNLPIFGLEPKRLSQNVKEQRKLLGQALLFLNTAPQVLGAEGKKTYLVLLQNNMELRPTGGFIGSYGLLSFEKGRFLGFEVFDVYWADGQLRGHVEPPMPIKKYLEQPHWFLRDSNWEPDFTSSAARASWFLEKETGQRVDGVVALDTSLIVLLLSVIGEVNLPDYQEVINKENLYQKTQLYAQEKFFPGSRQKANFLGALAQAIIDKLTSDKNISWLAVFKSLMLGAEEKHLLFAFNQPEIHNLFSLNSLTGSASPSMEGKEGELNDFLMIVEANLGVNKVNYFVKRNISASINIGEDGETLWVLRITYLNQSPREEYKNYLRLIAPSGTTVKKIELDQEEIKEVEIEQTQERTIFGFLARIPARSQKIISLTYQLPKPMPIAKGLNTYHLRVLKQPGTLEDPLTMTINYPSILTVQEIISPEGGKVFSPRQAVSIVSDLSRDRKFEIKFLNK